MKELRQQTLKGIMEKHPSKLSVIAAALEGMINKRITEHVEQALSSADVSELFELLQSVPVPAVEEPVEVLPLVPAVEELHIPTPEETFCHEIANPAPAPSKPHNHKKKNKHKKPTDLLD